MSNWHSNIMTKAFSNRVLGHSNVTYIQFKYNSSLNREPTIDRVIMEARIVNKFKENYSLNVSFCIYNNVKYVELVVFWIVVSL